MEKVAKVSIRKTLAQEILSKYRKVFFFLIKRKKPTKI